MPKSLCAHIHWQILADDLVDFNSCPGCFLSTNIKRTGWFPAYGLSLSLSLLLSYDAVGLFGLITLEGPESTGRAWTLEKYGCKMHEVYSDGVCHAGQMVAFPMLIGEECLCSQQQKGQEASPSVSRPPSPTHVLAAR